MAAIKYFCKIKSYGGEATYFHDKQVPKIDSNYTCLVVINLDSAQNSNIANVHWHH